MYAKRITSSFTCQELKNEISLGLISIAAYSCEDFVSKCILNIAFSNNSYVFCSTSKRRFLKDGIHDYQLFVKGQQLCYHLYELFMDKNIFHITYDDVVSSIVLHYFIFNLFPVYQHILQ